MESQVFFQNQVNGAADYFESWFFTGVYNWHFDGENIPKSIFADKLKSLSNDKEYIHNCIPCNLDDGANDIYQFLSKHRNEGRVKYFLTIYSLLFYLQAERCAVVYARLGYVNGKREFDWESFPVFQKIKYWANFFKHPKSSMFIHHPTFHIESSPFNPNFLCDGIINSEFVKRYYSGSGKNDELFDLLSNSNYKIFYPDLIEFTKELCSEFEKLIEIINSDSQNIEKLKEFRSNKHH